MAFKAARSAPRATRISGEYLNAAVTRAGLTTREFAERMTVGERTARGWRRKGATRKSPYFAALLDFVEEGGDPRIPLLVEQAQRLEDESAELRRAIKRLEHRLAAF